METDTLFRKLADNSFDIMNILNADATIRYESRATQRILGYEAGARVGRNALEFVHPEDQSYIQEQFQQLAATPGGRAFVEFRFCHKDGSWVWLETSGQNFLHDPDLQGILINSRDITERKQMEAALRESLARYDKLVTSIPVGIYVVWLRADGGVEFEYVSERWCEIHQVQREAVLADAAVVNNQVHPEERALFLKHNQEVQRNLTPFSWQGRFIIQGETRWLRLESTPTLMDNGDTRWFGVTQDITAQKQIEERLRTAEETYLHIFLKAQVGMFRTEIQTGLMLDANDAMAHFVGYRDREEMLAASVRIAERYVHRGDREKLLTRLQNNEEVTDFEAPFRRNDGTTIIVRLSARLVPDKGWIEGVAVDITKERQAEASLRESEEKFRQIAENIGEVFWLRSADNTRMLYINPAYERVWGRTCESLYENPQSFMDSVIAEDKPAVLAEFAEYVQTGEFALDYRIVRPDGEIRWVHARAFAVKDEQGQVIRHTGSAVDITARKQAEAALRESRDLLNAT
ncbi:MAG TPA: PAS domain S-box protein [Anaerolineae bacterium]|nr:PAS domain S-box protein [Anaerolineae bacterium]HQI87440.1 PAS domain S-box protein [Anaerolineae bacterium]